jgi:hypothetical protein
MSEGSILGSSRRIILSKKGDCYDQVGGKARGRTDGASNRSYFKCQILGLVPAQMRVGGAEADHKDDDPGND